MRNQILRSAIKSLVRDGLTAWTIDSVAHEAGCAKGLVHYHYRTKSGLLAAVAEDLRAGRLARRLDALGRSGTAALDTLWDVLVQEVRNGEFVVWSSLCVLNDSAVRRATRAGSEAAQLAQAADWVVARLEPAEEVGRLLAAALDGFQISLHRGEPHESIHQAYHRFWLTLLK